MNETEVTPETTPELCPTPCGDSLTIQVEMSDALGAIALAVISVLLLWALLKEQARNRALAQRLPQQGEVD